MPAPSVSICIPVYNGERFIRETISSLLSQTSRDFELLIVDNASTDRTGEVIASFKDPRIRYIRNERTITITDNWNRCIELAAGDIIALFHGDDVYHPDMVEKEAGLLEQNPKVGAVFTEALRIDENGRPIGTIRLPPGMRKKGVFAFKELFVQLIRNNYNPLVCPTCMARKSVYAKVGGYDGKAYKYVFDIDMYLRMAEVSDIAVVREPLIDYRIHPAQGTVRYDAEASDHNEVYDMYDKYIERHRSLLSESDLARYECFKRWDYTSHAIRALNRGDEVRAKGLLKRSFSRQRVITSFTDINLLFRLLISAAFLALTYAGLGKHMARLAAGRKIGYA